jgi:hypothetical protein
MSGLQKFFVTEEGKNRVTHLALSLPVANTLAYLTSLYKEKRFYKIDSRAKCNKSFTAVISQ